MTGADVGRASRLLLVTAYLAFIGLGLPDTITGVAWPGVRDDFALPQGGMGLILSSIAAGYLVSSASSGWVMRHASIGQVLTGSTALVILALLGWAATPWWWAFLVCACLLGAGGGAIDAALNYFVAMRFGTRHLNWLHAFYGIGATLGPLLMTSALALGLGWRGGVLTIAAILLPLAVLYGWTRRAWATDGGSAPAAAPAPAPASGAGAAVKADAPSAAVPGAGAAAEAHARTASAASAATPDAASTGPGLPPAERPLLGLPLALQLGAFFLLTGVEATLGQWSYTVMTEARGRPHESAGAWLAGFWAAFTLARLLAGLIAERVGTVRLMRAASLGLLLGVGAFVTDFHPMVASAGLLLAGLSLGPLFPGLMAETPRRLGAKAAQHAVGFQVGGAILGAAAVPSLAGVIAGEVGLAWVAAVLALAALGFVAVHESIVARLDRSGARAERR